MDQKQYFTNKESDEWFERNKKYFDYTKIRPQISAFSSYIKNGDRVLEIGCGSGENYLSLAQNKSIEYYGIDSSKQAIEYAQKHAPKGKFIVGSADQLDFDNDFFDFVLFGFCLYVIDRKTLMKTVCETDRVLKDKSYLGIWDFMNKYPIKRRYRDQENIFCYKMDYTSLWSSYPEYSVVLNRPSSHAADNFNADPSDRLASCVLYKDIESAYVLID